MIALFKKVIAGIMSAVLCTTVLLSDAPIGSRTAVQESGTPPEAQQQEGVSGTNSFGKYLQQKQNPDDRPAAKQLQAQAAAAPTYSVTNLEFDRETGLVRVMSSQNYDEKLVVLFVDEDDPSNVYRLETTVAAGELVLTELTADISKLPAFFTVTAYLVNRLDQPACEGVTLKTYTHFVQEMQATDITEFEPEQVVNLDESSDTNFFVLSEDTVQAKSDDTCNTLVSADYDHNVYVLGNIDETVRSLKKGQFFYIRPTEDDIITTQVLDIEITDDTATITGKDSIDEMFDFIKIEIAQDERSVYEDTEESVSEVPESEPVQADAVALTDEETEHIVDRHFLAGDKEKKDSPFKFEIDVPGDELYDPEKSDSETTISASFTKKSKNEVVSATVSLTIKVKDNLNVYKRFTEFDCYFTLETKTTVTLSGKITTSKNANTKLNANLLASLIGEPSSDCGVEKNGSKDIKIATPIPGIFIVAGVTLSFTPTVVGEASLTYHSKRGLHYDGNLYRTLVGDEGIVERRLKVKASVELKVSLHAGLSLLGVLEAGVDFTLKGVLTAEIKHVDKTNVEADDPDMDNPSSLKDKLHSFAIPNYEDDRSDDAIHACMFCIDGTIKVTFTAGVYLKLLIFKSEATLVEIPIWEGHFYFSLSYNELGFGKCPHIAYKTTFELSVYDLVHDCPAKVPAGLTIMVDGDTYTFNSDGKLVLYCVPKENHTYIVLCDGHKLSSGSFQINDESKTISIPVELMTDKDTGEIDYGKTQTKVGGNQDISVTPVTTEPAETFTPPMTTCLMPQLPKKQETVDAVQLGDDIWGHAYPDGGIWIHGIGDMYDFSSYSPFKAETRQRTRYIVLEDADPKHGGFINSIGQNVFKDFENLECVYMPARILSVNASAFEGCAKLKYLRYGGIDDDTETFILPVTLQTVGNRAFSGCASAVFGDLEIPASVSAIGSGAFAGCTGIRTLYVPDDNKPTIGGNAFESCTALTKAVLAVGVGKIERHIFQGCAALEDLTIPSFHMSSSETEHHLCYYFQKYAQTDDWDFSFDDAKGWMGPVPYYVPAALKHVTVLSGTEIPDRFFISMEHLETVILKGDIEKVGQFAFNECAGLEMIDFGNVAVTTDTIILPDTLKTIGERAFDGCKSAKFGKLVIPESMETIDTSAFRACEGITALHVPGYIEDTGEKDENGNPVLKKRLTLGSTVFSSCSNIKSAVFGDGIAKTGLQALAYCYNVEELTFASFAMNSTLKNNVARFFNEGNGGVEDLMYSTYTTGGNASTYFHYVPNVLKRITITDETEIPAGFFSSLKNLETVICPKGITAIHANAFEECANLKYIGSDTNPAEGGQLVIPETVTLIDNSAFKGCTNAPFGDLRIPESVNQIGPYAFASCQGITSVNISGRIAEDGTKCLELGACAFSRCYGLKKIVLGSGISNCASHAFEFCCNVEDFTLSSFDMGNGWLKNSMSMFFNEGNSGVEGKMTSIYETGGIASTYYNYVPNCLTKVTFTDETVVPGRFFQGMNMLKSITLSGKTESVKENAFNGCEALAEAYLIGEEADWDNVDIDERGNDPLLRLVRKAKPVVITADPADVTANAGTEVSFRVSAAGKYALSYLWQSSGDGGSTWGKAGSTSDTLSFKAADAHNGRLYRCVVTDEKGNEAISAAAKLTVSGKAASDKPEGYNPGDLNGDGMIDVSDAVLLARFVAEDATANITRLGILNADVDGNGNAESDDIILILQFICKKIKVFPVAQKP